MTRIRLPPPALLLLLLMPLASIRAMTGWGVYGGAAPESLSTSGQSDVPGRIGWWRRDDATSVSKELPAEPTFQKMVEPSANMDAGDVDCMVDFGLADGTIPDQNITGWPNVSFPGAPDYSSPAGARLNSATAWCVNASSFTEDDATLTIDLGRHRLLSGFKVQASPTEVHSRDHSSFLMLEYSLDGISWTSCCSVETVGVLQLFSILDQFATLDTVREYYFGLLKLARYVRFRFEKSSWPQQVQCVRLEIVGCQADWLPAPSIWHIAEPRGWLDILWKAPTAKLHDGDNPVISWLPVDSYSLTVQHQEGSELITSHAETTSTRWSVTRPVWNANYVITLRVKIAGVALDWAQYRVRAKVPCPDGLRRCALEDAVFVLPDVLQSVWNGTNNTLVTSWSMTSRGWRVPEFMFSAVFSGAGTGVTNQIIGSSVVQLEIPDLPSDQDYEVFISPVVPELLSAPTYHRNIMLVPTGSSPSSQLSRMVEAGSAESSSSMAAVTADVSLRAWPRWSGDILIRWQPAVLRGDTGTLAAPSYHLTVSTGDRQLNSSIVPGRGETDPIEAQYTGSVAVGTEYRIQVECQFPTRNFSCGSITVVPTAPATAEPTSSGWRVFDVPEPAGSWSEASSTCQWRGGHLVSITGMEQQLQAAQMLETLGQSQAWIGLNLCPFNGRWSDGTRARLSDIGTPPKSSAGECCVKLFRTENVASGTVMYQWVMEVCDTVLPPLCASKVQGGMVYPVENLTARSDLPLTLDLTWKPRSSGWAPSSCLVQLCPTKDLSRPEATLALPCTNWTSTNGLKAHITGLAGYQEFEVTVWSRLASVQSKESASVTARSLSLLPLSMDISRSGRLTAVWRRKVVQGAADQQADVVVRQLDIPAPPSPSVQALSRALAATQRASDIESDASASVDPPAAETESRLSSDEVRQQASQDIRWSGLEPGARYMLALFDVGANDTTDFVVFSAGPTCMEGEYQLGALCFWPSQETARYSEAPAKCAVSGDASGPSSSLRTQPWMAPISTAEEYRLVKNLSLWLDKSFWVFQQEKRRRRRDAASQEIPPDVELLPGHRPPPPPPARPTFNPFAEIISKEQLQDEVDEDFSETDAAESDDEFVGAQETQPKPCTYVQKGRNGIQASTSSCEEEMQGICSTNITVTVPEFREGDLRIEPSSSSIRLDWIVPEAWAASYLVTVYKRPPPTTSSGQTGSGAEPEHDVRIKRAADSATYTAPPVVLKDLEENALYEVTIVRQSAGRQTMVGPVVIRALDPPRQTSMFPADDGPRMCLALSYVVVIVTAILIVVILLLARVPVLEGIYQITLAVALAIGYIIILLSHGGPLSEGRTTGCRAAATVIHLAYSVALTAVLLLALAMPRLLGAAPYGFPGKHAWAVPLMAAAPQTVVVMLVLAGAVHSQGYVDGAPQTCWLELDPNNAIMWVVVCHLLLIWVAGLALTFRALTLGSDKLPPPPKHPDKLQRGSALMRLRFTTLALLLLLAACWALGATAAFYGERALVISEAVFTTLLAVTLGILCADTFIAGSRPWRQRVTPELAPRRPAGRPPANLKLTTVHPAGNDGNMMVKRTFHFGADPAEADRKSLFAMPMPD